MSPAPTAGAAFTQAVAAGVRSMLSQVPAVRADEPDSVHQLRVATRRLRSVLRSGRRLARKRPTRQLRDELRWLATLLGTARDAEVRAGRLQRLAQVDDGAVSAALATRQRAVYASAHTDIVAALDSPRYTKLAGQLSRWQAHPPLRPRATTVTATSAYTQILGAEQQRLGKLVARTTPSDTAGLHEVRKAAKRLRYSAEAAQELGLPRAARLAGQAKTLQSVLGAHRDALETADLISTALGGADPAFGLPRGQRAAACQLLLASERESAAAALRGYRAAAAFAE